MRQTTAGVSELRNAGCGTWGHWGHTKGCRSLQTLPDEAQVPSYPRINNTKGSSKKKATKESQVWLMIRGFAVASASWKVCVDCYAEGKEYEST